MWESNRNLNVTAEETQSQVWPQWCQIEVQTYWQFHLPIFHWSVKQIFLPQTHYTFRVDVLSHLYVATVFIMFRISSYKLVSYRGSSHWACLLWSERNCSRCPFAVWFHTQFDSIKPWQYYCILLQCRRLQFLAPCFFFFFCDSAT